MIQRGPVSMVEAAPTRALAVWRVRYVGTVFAELVRHEQEERRACLAEHEREERERRRRLDG